MCVYVFMYWYIIIRLYGIIRSEVYSGKFGHADEYSVEFTYLFTSMLNNNRYNNKCLVAI